MLCIYIFIAFYYSPYKTLLRNEFFFVPFALNCYSTKERISKQKKNKKKVLLVLAFEIINFPILFFLFVCPEQKKVFIFILFFNIFFIFSWVLFFGGLHFCAEKLCLLDERFVFLLLQSTSLNYH